MKKILKIACYSVAFTQLPALGTDINTSMLPSSDMKKEKNYEIDVSGNYRFLGNLQENPIDGLPSALVAYLADKHVDVAKEFFAIKVSGPIQFIINHGDLGDYKLKTIRALEFGVSSDPTQPGPYKNDLDSDRIANVLSKFITNYPTTVARIGKNYHSDLYIEFSNPTSNGVCLNLIFVPYDPNNIYQNALLKLRMISK